MFNISNQKNANWDQNKMHYIQPSRMTKLKRLLLLSDGEDMKPQKVSHIVNGMQICFNYIGEIWGIFLLKLKIRIHYNLATSPLSTDSKEMWLSTRHIRNGGKWPLFEIRYKPGEIINIYIKLSNGSSYSYDKIPYCGASRTNKST